MLPPRFSYLPKLTTEPHFGPKSQQPLGGRKGCWQKWPLNDHFRVALETRMVLRRIAFWLLFQGTNLDPVPCTIASPNQTHSAIRHNTKQITSRKATNMPFSNTNLDFIRLYVLQRPFCAKRTLCECYQANAIFSFQHALLNMKATSCHFPLELEKTHVY